MDDLPGRIEHTVLGPTTTWAAVTEVLDEAVEYGMRACIPPCYLERATAYAPEVPVTTVIGFPHGHHETELKCDEAEQAYAAGAAELDMVANVGWLLSDDPEAVQTDIAEVVAAAPVPVKVIVEAPLLSETELRSICERAQAADADFLKTATGFSEGGATVEDVAVMSEYLPVKASGGVGSWAFAERLFAAGAERIGASSGVTIVQEYERATSEN